MHRFPIKVKNLSQALPLAKQFLGLGDGKTKAKATLKGTKKITAWSRCGASLMLDLRANLAPS